MSLVHANCYWHCFVWQLHICLPSFANLLEPVILEALRCCTVNIALQSGAEQCSREELLEENVAFRKTDLSGQNWFACLHHDFWLVFLCEVWTWGNQHQWQIILSPKCQEMLRGGLVEVCTSGGVSSHQYGDSDKCLAKATRVRWNSVYVQSYSQVRTSIFMYTSHITACLSILSNPYPCDYYVSNACLSTFPCN